MHDPTFDIPEDNQDNEDDYYQSLILSFIASLTLCDHMGDVANTVDTLLKKIGINIKWDDFDDLHDWCAKNGIKTLYGTELTISDDEIPY